MPEGHTLHRLATALDDAFAGRPVRVEQPAGPVRRVGRAARRPGRWRAPSRGASTCSSSSRTTTSCTSTSGSTAGSTCTATSPRCPPPVGQVRLRLVGGRPTTRRTPTCAAPPPASCSPRQQRDALRGPARARPAAPGRRPGPGLAAHPAQPRPIGGLLMDQTVVAGIGNVYRAELLFRHRVDPFRPGTSCACGQWRGDVGRPGRADGRRRAHRPDRHRAPRAPHRGEEPRRHERRPRRRGTPTSTAAPASRAGSAATRVRTQVLQGRNLYWCPRCQPRFRSRAVQ